jgi:hypothetical protein
MDSPVVQPVDKKTRETANRKLANRLPVFDTIRFDSKTTVPQQLKQIESDLFLSLCLIESKGR